MSNQIKSALYSCIASACLLSAALAGAIASPVHAESSHHQVRTEAGRGGVPIVAVTINGRGPFKFVVDTGAPGPLRIDTKVADAIGLKAVRYDEEGDGSGNNEFKVAVVPVETLGLGTFAKSGLEANVMDLKGRGFEFDGVFGMTAFADDILTIDYAHGTLAIDRGSLPPANGKDIFDYELTDDGLIRLQVAVGAQQLSAILDTGQTMAGILVPEAAARAVAASAPVLAGKARTVSNSYSMYEVTVDGPVIAQGVRLPIKNVRYPAIGSEANIGSKAFVGGVLRLDQRNRRIQLTFPGTSAK
jgi:predicted aspartyl protease